MREFILDTEQVLHGPEQAAVVFQQVGEGSLHSTEQVLTLFQLQCMEGRCVGGFTPGVSVVHWWRNGEWLHNCVTGENWVWRMLVKM